VVLQRSKVKHPLTDRDHSKARTVVCSPSTQSASS